MEDSKVSRNPCGVSGTKPIYKESRCRVVHEDQFTDSFEIKTGVRLGCLLSPFLFIIVIDWLMSKTIKRTKEWNTVYPINTVRRL